jgi:CO/xanthine dehydrogenase Mo-binding subunit
VLKNTSNKVRDNHDRLLRGKGRYLDDVSLPDCLHVAYVRSSVANARITRIQTSAASELDGVSLVLTAGDLGPLNRPLPLLRPHPDVPYPKTMPPLASERASFVGQPIVMVVAVNRYVAEDACGLVEVEYEPLPVVADITTALEGERLVHDDVPGNLAGIMSVQRGDADEALRQAPFRERLQISIERSCGCPMETRGVAASWDPDRRELQVWDSTQNPIAIHHGLVRILGLADNEVRVVAPDVGGGFGTKIMMFYPEEVLVPYAALRLGVSVKWIEDRWEHLVSSNQERGQLHDAEIGFDGDGKILAVRTEFVHDNGAFAPYGPSVPEVTMTHITGQYDIEHFFARACLLYTNTPSVTPYRGAGRPQAVFVMERLIACVARRLNIEPYEIRRRNLIKKDQFPHDTGLKLLGTEVVYDSGDYQAAFSEMDRALPLSDFRPRQRAARRDGKLLGIGFATYIEGSAPGPYETARCSLDASGRVRIIVSPPSQGQNHETVFAKIVAEIVGVDFKDVIFVAGDSRQVRSGTGTFGSRAAVYVANAVASAAKVLRDQIIQHAAQVLGAEAENITIKNGQVGIVEEAESFVSLADLVTARNSIAYVNESPSVARLRAASLSPTTGDCGLGWPEFEAQGTFSASRLTYGSGLHGCIVEVDPRFGTVKIEDYVVVDDCGVVLDPLTVQGQIFGGVAQGIGGALLEKLMFDQEGQPLSSTLMTFLLPTINDVPRVRLASVRTPSPINPLGIKGVGEAGVIAVPSAVAEAIDDALAGEALPVSASPIFPEYVVELIQLHDEKASRH